MAARMLERRMLSLTPKESIPNTLQMREGPPGVQPDAAGIFVVPNVTEGRYDVELDIYYPYPSGEYLADIRQSGRSIIESGVTITQQPPAPIDVLFEPGGATLTGQVRDAGNRPTFDRLVVLLSRVQGRRRALYSQTASANSSGTYSFANVAPGDYLVFAPTTTRDWKNESDLLVRTLAARARTVTVRRGAVLTVPADIVDTATLPPLSATISPPIARPAAAPPAPAPAAASRPSPGGVIMGRVLDATGRPVRGARVAALKPQFMNGERDFGRVLQHVETNDLGEFRLFWLPPGAYYLAAVPPDMQNGRAVSLYPRMAAATFFPGVRRAADAVRLNVAEGETRADLTLPPMDDAYLISGDAVIAPAMEGRLMFYSMPRGADARLHSAFGLMFGDSPFNIRRSGSSFTLNNILPSRYDLYVIGPDNMSALVSLTVDGRNATGIVATLAPNPTLTLRVTVDGATATTVPRIRPLDPLPAVVGSSPTGERRGDGLFAFTMLEGRYRLEVSDYSTTAYVADIRDGVTSILAPGIIVGRSMPGNLDVIVRTDGGTIDGALTAAGRVAGATIVLAPSAGERHIGERYRTAETAADGTFRLQAIAPGTYSIFVMNESDWAIDQLSRIAELRDADARIVTIAPRSYQQIQLPAPR